MPRPAISSGSIGVRWGGQRRRLAANNRNVAIYDSLIIDTSVDDHVFALDATRRDGLGDRDPRLAARGESPAAFDRRCIPPDYVASRSNTAGILPRRACQTGASPVSVRRGTFNHGLLGDEPRHAELRADHRQRKVISGRSCVTRDSCVITAHDARTGAELWDGIRFRLRVNRVTRPGVTWRSKTRRRAISAETGKTTWLYEQRAATTSLVATGAGSSSAAM